MTARAPDHFELVLETTQGEVRIAVVRAWAPYGADRLFNMARNGIFRQQRFYRVVTGWVVQFGVSAEPDVSAVYNHLNDIDGAIIADDWEVSDPPLDEGGLGAASARARDGIGNTRGVLSYSAAYSDAGKATNRTTELYINFADNRRLDPMGFTPVGIVLGDGMDAVVDKLYAGYGEMPAVCANRSSSANRNYDTPCAGPDEDRLYAEGNAYLQAEFPLMDSIVDAYVVSATLSGAGPGTGEWAAAGLGRFASGTGYSTADDTPLFWAVVVLAGCVVVVVLAAVARFVFAARA